MKKRFALLLTLAMLLTMLPAFVVGATAEEAAGTSVAFERVDIPADAQTVEKDGNTYTVLRTVEDLEKLGENNALTVEEGESVATRYYILANDIDFGGEEPERYSLKNVVLDGNGYSYLNFTLSGTGSQSLFAIVKDQETVIRNINFGSSGKRVAVTISNEAAVTGSTGVGVLLSYTNSYFRFENINIYADITASERICVGGFVGNMGGGTADLVNCSFYGSVTGNATANADVGYAGFFGKLSSGVVITMEQCCNYAAISTPGTGTSQKTSGILYRKRRVFRQTKNSPQQPCNFCRL